MNNVFGIILTLTLLGGGVQPLSSQSKATKDVIQLPPNIYMSGDVMEPFVTKHVEAQWNGDALVGRTIIKYTDEDPKIIDNTFKVIDNPFCTCCMCYWVAADGICFTLDTGSFSDRGTINDVRDFLVAAGARNIHVTWKIGNNDSWNRFVKKWSKRTKVEYDRDYDTN